MDIPTLTSLFTSYLQNPHDKKEEIEGKIFFFISFSALSAHPFHSHNDFLIPLYALSFLGFFFHHIFLSHFSYSIPCLCLLFNKIYTKYVYVYICCCIKSSRDSKEQKTNLNTIKMRRWQAKNAGNKFI